MTNVEAAAAAIASKRGEVIVAHRGAVWEMDRKDARAVLDAIDLRFVLLILDDVTGILDYLIANRQRIELAADFFYISDHTWEVLAR